MFCSNLFRGEKKNRFVAEKNKKKLFVANRFVARKLSFVATFDDIKKKPVSWPWPSHSDFRERRTLQNSFNIMMILCNSQITNYVLIGVRNPQF